MHNEFVGAPNIGRLAMLRFSHDILRFNNILKSPAIRQGFFLFFEQRIYHIVMQLLHP